MVGNGSGQYLLGKKLMPAKSAWFADVADIFVLLCSFLLTTASITLVILTFCIQAAVINIPTGNTLSILQRSISALSATITSAVILVAGKRYVLLKFTTGGIRSQGVAVYSNPSIGNLAHYLVFHNFEPPVLVLMVVWALGLATGLTVNDVWTMVPAVYSSMPITVPSGPFDNSVVPGSFLVPATAQLIYVMGSVCSMTTGSVGLIKIGGDLQLASGGPTGTVYYPPVQNFITDSMFSFSTSLNGFNISMEQLPSIPPTAQNLTCVIGGKIGFGTGRLWYGGGDNHTLSIIAAGPRGFYRFNASAIVLGGTLQSTGDATEFVPNGTTWLNVMSDDQWARDIASLVCNTTQPLTDGRCTQGSSLFDFAINLNLLNSSIPNNLSATMGIYWGTAFGMAMGAYSAVWWRRIGVTQNISATLRNVLLFRAHYGVYVLIANIVVSVIMLVVVVRLRMASRLRGDFINATRLLLDPLKNPELFNATLDTTVDALGNPYMSVSEDNEFLLAEKSLEKTKKRRAG